MATQSSAQRVAAAIRAAMSDQNVTQSTLASVLNRSQAAVSRRLNGSVEFNITELHAIAELLDVDVAQLLGAEGRTVRSAS